MDDTIPSEFAILSRLRAASGPPRPGEVHAGDDAALLLPPAGRIVVATDMLVDGVHVDLAFQTPEDVGWKAMAVNLSDLAAMGATPRAALAAVACPDPVLVEPLAAGLRAHGVPLVGGDLVEAAPLAVAVTVLGEESPHGSLLRSGGRPGDDIWVTGALGAAAAGLRAARRAAGSGAASGALRRALDRPVPHLAAGALLASLPGVTACIDVSDGLAADAGHIAEESGTGVEIDAVAVPVADGVAAWAGGDDAPPGRAPTLWRALTGGDDYVRCCAAAPGTDLVGPFAAADLAVPVSVGRLGGAGIRLRTAGRTVDLEGVAGWQHFRSR